MLDIPFPLETVPSARAEGALQDMIDQARGVAPVLLGDRDIFSTEWAETVDHFEVPETILKDAQSLDVDAWFANRGNRRAKVEPASPFLPSRLVSWMAGKPKSQSVPGDAGQADYLVAMLRGQLAELEEAGEGTREDLAEIREVIDGIEADGMANIFPDPVDYVTPKKGTEVAAGLLAVSEPWESAAWLQHGAYAICAPKAVFAAHCRWMWTEFGARIITASTDHMGFQMDRPIDTPEAAQEVLRRFAILGATEINGDQSDALGQSLIGASRLWVWWD